MSEDLRAFDGLAVLAAAKTTLIAAVGCSSGRPAATSGAAQQPEAPAMSARKCERHLQRLPTVEKNELAADDPLRERPDVFGKVFADRAERASETTLACCRDTLAREGPNTEHRWSCCSALPRFESQEVHLACSPWCPPCPPAMPV